MDTLDARCRHSRSSSSSRPPASVLSSLAYITWRRLACPHPVINYTVSLSLSLQPLLCRRSVGIRKYCHPHTTLIDSPTIDNCNEPLCFYFNCSITSGAKQAPAEINVPYISHISVYQAYLSQFLPAGRRCVCPPVAMCSSGAHSTSCAHDVAFHIRLM